MPIPNTRWLLLGCAVVLWISSSGCSKKQATNEQSTAAPSAEQLLPLLPAFVFSDLAGKKVSSGAFRGKVLLVDIWATWCQPCKKEMPWFQELYDQYHGRGLEVVGISVDFVPADAAKYARELGIHYTILDHPEVMKEWGLLGLPTTFVVDRQGRIRRKVIGFEYKEAFETAVKELL